jgi:hypothetical protein
MGSQAYHFFIIWVGPQGDYLAAPVFIWVGPLGDYLAAHQNHNFKAVELSFLSLYILLYIRICSRPLQECLQACYKLERAIVESAILVFRFGYID